MLCVASFIVFGILGIFSASYRELAFEAYNCMLDRLTRGECDADFEDKIRATVIGRALDYSPRFASFLETHLEVLSIIFVALFLISFLLAAKALIYLAVYGSCNGPNTGCSISGGLL